MVLVLRHIHALAAEMDAFHLQACALFEPGFPLQLDRAARSHHALPRQPDPRWLEWEMDFPHLRYIILHMIKETACHACS